VRERIVPTAQLFTFVREATRNNDGPWVEAIQRVTGNKRGDPWCASFVAAVLDMAYGGANPLPRTASCDVLLRHARQHGKVVTDPEPGDVFLVLRSPMDAIHTGFVTAVYPDAVGTLEGNTNEGGSRDGWGVFARVRPRSGLVFVRP
jgi:hypothetical protein